MNFDVIEEARRVFDAEIVAMQKTRDSLGEDFEQIINLILNCQGKVVVTGMGKPGHIAKRLRHPLQVLERLRSSCTQARLCMATLVWLIARMLL